MMEFRKEEKNVIRRCKGMHLAIFIGKSNRNWAKSGFERPRFTRWKMKKPIKNPVNSKQLELYDYLPHQ